jgi:PPOX class probable F420-dependent enzyme
MTTSGSACSTSCYRKADGRVLRESNDGLVGRGLVPRRPAVGRHYRAAGDEPLPYQTRGWWAPAARQGCDTDWRQRRDEGNHMPQMTESEWRRFLGERPRTAKLATVRKDGRPHVAPVWFAPDRDDLIFTTGKTSVKGQAIRRDPRVSLCVDDEQPPFAFVIIEGTATVSENLAELRAWATRIAARYMGAALADAFGARNGVPGELLVRVRPTRVVAATGISD